jgi:hypothetical protein
VLKFGCYTSVWYNYTGRLENKDINERKTFNFSVHKTRQEQRDNALRPKMGWNGFSWLRKEISG